MNEPPSAGASHKLPELRIPGVVLSALLYDAAAAPGQLDGLLTGHAYKTCTRKLNDNSDAVVLDTQLGCLIQGFIPAERRDSGRLYDNCGRVNDTVLRSVMGGKSDPQEVIGYFKFRWGSPLQPSLRDMAVHDSLAKAVGKPAVVAAGFAGEQREGVPFLLMLVGASVSEESVPGAVWTFSYAAWIRTRHEWPEFRRVPISVANLVESAQNEYDNFMSSMAGAAAEAAEKENASPGSALFRCALAKVPWQQIVGVYNDMCLESITAQEVAAAALAKSEADLAVLREEVERLRQLKSEREERRRRSPARSLPANDDVNMGTAGFAKEGVLVDI